LWEWAGTSAAIGAYIQILVLGLIAFNLLGLFTHWRNIPRLATLEISIDNDAIQHQVTGAKPLIINRTEFTKIEENTLGLVIHSKTTRFNVPKTIEGYDVLKQELAEWSRIILPTRFETVIYYAVVVIYVISFFALFFVRELWLVGIAGLSVMAVSIRNIVVVSRQTNLSISTKIIVFLLCAMVMLFGVFRILLALCVCAAS
jgi:preprotein translocase subunit SecE